MLLNLFLTQNKKSMKRVGLCLALNFLVVSLYSCRNVAIYPLDEHPTIKIDTALLGVWQADDGLYKDHFLVRSFDDVYKDVSAYGDDSLMLAEKQYKDYLYYISEVDKNKGDFDMIAFQSTINNTRLVNFGLYTPVEKRYKNGYLHQGTAYMFMKLKNMNSAKTQLTLVPDMDTTMLVLNSCAEVRKRVTAVLRNKLYFSDSAVFKKVSNDHWNRRKY